MTMGMFTRILDPVTKEEFQVKFGNDTCKLHVLGDKLWEVEDGLYWESADDKWVVVVQDGTIVAVLRSALDGNEDHIDRMSFETDLLRELFWPGSVEGLFDEWMKWESEIPSLWRRIKEWLWGLMWWRRKRQIGQFTKWVLPMVRKTYPKLAMDQIVSVQSMTAEIEMDVESRKATEEETARDRRIAHQGDAIERFVKVLGSEFKFDFEYTIPCSCCGGKLTFSKSSWNGHRHVRCETKGCGSWME